MTDPTTVPQVANGELARRAIELIDLTDLGDDATAERTTTLCDRARAHGTAAVCVWPDFVGVAAASLDGCAVKVATVVNFPSGDERAHATAVLTERALQDGADEIDVVLPYRAWLRGDHEWCRHVLQAAIAPSHQAGAIVKVILETGALPDLDVIAATSRFAIDLGADFIKTSTGKIERSATPDAVETMLAEIASTSRPVGLKPSGGIRTTADAGRYLALADAAMGPHWVSPSSFRFGASALLDDLLAVLDAGDDEVR